MTDVAQRPWAEHIKYMARVEVSHIFAEEARNPPRCESAKAYRAGAPLTEALEIARNVYAARTGQPVMDLDDEAVLANAKSGNRRALDLLASRLLTRAVFAAKGRPCFLSHEDAEDVAQDAVLKTIQKIDRVREARNLVPFLLRIVNDLAIDLKRSQSRTAKVIIFNSDLVDALLEGGPNNG